MQHGHMLYANRLDVGFLLNETPHFPLLWLVGSIYNLLFLLLPLYSFFFCIFLRNFFRQCLGSSKARTLGLLVVVSRDWAWFTATKWIDYKPKYIEQESYNTYILAKKKYICME